MYPGGDGDVLGPLEPPFDLEARNPCLDQLWDPLHRHQILRERGLGSQTDPHDADARAVAPSLLNND